MPIADRNVVRKLAGNRSVAILPDADIDQAIESSDSFVNTATNKIDWNTSDPAYPMIKKASEYFASAELLSRWEDQQDESEEQFDRAQYYIKTINENITTATGGEDVSGDGTTGSIVNIVKGKYHTSPMTYRSTRWLLWGDNGEAIEGLADVSPARYD